MNDVPIHAREPRPSGPQWTDRYRGAVMNTFGDPQRVLVRGDGAMVWDADGNCYIDLLAGIAVNSLGHAHPALLKSVTEQLGQLGHISNFFASEPQITLAEKLLDLAGRNGRVFFANSGTEANEAAIKLTRRTGRTTIVAAHGSFHGRTMGALALTSKPAYRLPFEPLPGDVRWVPFGDVDALSEAVDGSVAAVVLEPIQGEAGIIVPPTGYLSQAREITRSQGALLWFDEVQSGMGRSGEWFAHQVEDASPDIVTLAKGLGGGVPIGACLAFGAAATLLGPGNHGTTFGGNPVAAAASLAVIETIEAEDLFTRVRQLEQLFREGLSNSEHVADVTGRGLMLGVALTRSIAAAVQVAALDAGVIVNAPTPDRLRLTPPFILTDKQAKDAIATLISVLAEVASQEQT